MLALFTSLPVLAGLSLALLGLLGVVLRGLGKRQRAGEVLLGPVFNGMSEACFALDTDFRYTRVNAQWEKMYGKREAEVLGRSLYEVFPAVRGTTIDRCLRQTLSERIATTH